MVPSSQNTVPASGPVTHRQVPSSASSLAPIQAPRPPGIPSAARRK
ncbi:MAG: hypothetical protein KME25_10800 [Symplocastrum torsivum CPER-KK1]|uniref:Uncharacterized protein n=1 Tax=Symplocastrum torsivum CPER-KK1 TaxID=450513 RepID=A0A951PKG2_9CYAN|nr:hypothetical protein [Symplocastrum torsivum CPER-KK1]